MQECTEECQQDVWQSVGEAMSMARTGEINWISAVTCNVDTLPGEDSISSPIQPLTAQDIRDSQNADPVISRVMTLKRKHDRLTYKDKLKETLAVRQLLREWPRLRTDEEGILQRETVSRKQLVIPESLKPVIYKHLHEEMGHLHVPGRPERNAVGP